MQLQVAKFVNRCSASCAITCKVCSMIFHVGDTLFIFVTLSLFISDSIAIDKFTRKQ